MIEEDYGFLVHNSIWNITTIETDHRDIAIGISSWHIVDLSDKQHTSHIKTSTQQHDYVNVL